MVKKGLFFFLMSLLVAGSAAPVLASSTMTGTVNFNNFSIDFYYYDGDAHYPVLALEYKSKLNGEAYYSPYEKVTNSTDGYQTSPTSIVFADPSLSWIKSMSTYNNTDPGHMSAEFSGVAPNRDVYYAGALYQEAFFILHSQFTLPNTATYHINLSTTYSYSLSIQNAASGNYFTSAELGIGWSIYEYEASAEYPWYFQPIQTVTKLISPGKSLDLSETDLSASYQRFNELSAGTYDIYIPIRVYQLGYTSLTPLPGTTLLLGAGLGCLALYSRRKQTDNN